MVLLKNGCHYSGLSVTPSNWDKPRAPMNCKWYIRYRFYTPDCPAGKLKVIKSGINRLKDRTQRQEAVKALLDLEKDLLENKGYNPILNRIVETEEKTIPEQSSNETTPTNLVENKKVEPDALKDPYDDELYIISPKCGFIEALYEAYERLDLHDSTKLAIRGVLKGMEDAAKAL